MPTPAPRLGPVVAAWICAVGLTACTTTYRFAMASRTEVGIHRATAVQKDEIDCPSDAETVAIDVWVDGVRGQCTVSVRDPDGRIVLSTTVGGPGRVEQSERLAAVPGKWTSEIVLADFGGSYSFGMSASSDN